MVDHIRTWSTMVDHGRPHTHTNTHSHTHTHTHTYTHTLCTHSHLRSQEKFRGDGESSDGELSNSDEGKEELDGS